MSKKLFFTSAAKAAFAFAAVVMMSTVFTSCSKDSDDDNGGLPTPKAQTVTIDGVEKPILNAEYNDVAGDNYYLYLYLSTDRKESVYFEHNKDLHMNGKPFNLTEKEKKHKGKWYWSVQYYKPDDTRLINTFGDPDAPWFPVFTTGTLTVSGLPNGTINIKLENGRVKGSDDKEHTFTLSYSGTMTKE